MDENDPLAAALARRQPQQTGDPIMDLLMSSDIGQAVAPVQTPQTKKRQTLALAMMMGGGGRGLGRAGNAMYNQIGDDQTLASQTAVRQQALDQSRNFKLASVMQAREAADRSDARFNRSQEAIAARQRASIEAMDRRSANRPVRGIFDPNTNMLVDPTTGSPIAGQQPQALAGPQKPGFNFPNNNPGKLTETEDKSRFFAQNMAEQLPALADTLQKGYRPSYQDMMAAGPTMEGMAGRLQEFTPRGLASADGQNFYTAGRKVLASILRKESGAAITADEWQSYGPMYLPWPGDSDDLVKSKMDGLYNSVQSMSQGAGRASQHWQQPVQPQGPRRQEAAPEGHRNYENEYGLVSE